MIETGGMSEGTQALLWVIGLLVTGGGGYFVGRKREVRLEPNRLERAIAARQELQGLSDYAALDARTADAYLALANDAILSGDPDRAAKIVEAAVKINAASLRLAEQRQQAERLDLQRQELALRRERFEAAEKRLADATGVAADETLSETERLARIKTIFGLA